MRLTDDTPEPGALPPLYPREAPRNLISNEHLRPNNFFVFEGIDGAGKSTLLQKVLDEQRRVGRPAHKIKLGGSDVIRHAMERAKWINADPMTLNLLNWASLYEQCVAHAALLDTQTLVLVDRYSPTVRLRGTFEGLDEAHMDSLENGLPQPTAIFIVDCDLDICMSRLRATGRKISYFEAGTRHVDGTGVPMVESTESERSDDFPRESLFLRHLTRLRDGYRRLASRYANVHWIDNSGGLNTAVATILGHMS